MIVNKCEHCKRFIVRGVTNEFKEPFCDKKCYEKYCVNHKYTPNTDNLKPFDNLTSNSI